MIPDITIKRNDAGKVISGQLIDADGAPVNCTGFVSAKLFWINRVTLVKKIDGVTFNFSNQATGQWNYICTAADLDTAGRFDMELEVEFAGGVKQTFPTNRAKPYLLVVIQNDLG